MPSRGRFGYVRVYCPGHPRANHGYVLEHILVVEAALGHFLRADAEIHHVDGVKAHNENTNLVACDSGAYHKLIEQRQRALAACGNANALRCKFCKCYDLKPNIVHYRSGQPYHPRCVASYRRSS